MRHVILPVTKLKKDDEAYKWHSCLQNRRFQNVPAKFVLIYKVPLVTLVRHNAIYSNML